MNFLKIAFTLVLAFAFYGASAQILGVGDAADYEDATTVPIVSYMTEGTTMPLWVMPDALYHPGYDPETDDISADGFTWTWVAPGAVTVGSDDNDNYVTITPPVTGVQTDYAVTVAETLPVAMGGCSDPSPVSITVRAVLAPEIVDFPFFTALPLVEAATFYYCGDQAAQNVSVEFNGIPNYQLPWTMAVTEIDGAGNPVANGNNYSVDNTTVPDVIGVGNVLVREANATYNFDAGRTFISLLDGADKVRTRYTYTIGGVTDNISRKSDYLGAKTWYDDNGGSYTYTIIVNLAPVTGPIYHITNTNGNL